MAVKQTEINFEEAQEESSVELEQQARDLENAPLSSFKIHSKENNSESESHLKENEVHFSNQCKKLFDLLMTGERISFADAFIKYQISDIRRRAKDLTDCMNVELSKEWQGKIKYWFMTSQQIENNKKFL